MCREDTSTGEGLADARLYAKSRDPGKRGAKGLGERVHEQAGGRGELGECRLTEDPPLTNEDRNRYRGGGEALWRLEGKETLLKGSFVSWGEPSLIICHSYLSWLDITS